MVARPASMPAGGWPGADARSPARPTPRRPARRAACGTALLAALAAAGCGGSTEGGGSGGTAGAGATGGAGGAAGGGTGGSAGAAGVGAAPAECTSDADCTLVGGCCGCLALSPTDPRPPSCNEACLVDACEGSGAAGAVCRGGQCVVAADCDQTHAQCFMMPPTCPPGELPRIVSGCFGPCVPARTCLAVSACASCGADDVCVVDVGGAEAPGSRRCEPVSPACQGDPTCACLGDALCQPPYGFCTDPGPRQLACECVNC